MMNDALVRDIDKVISCMDSFQQDNGELRFRLSIDSYAMSHRIIVNIFRSDKITKKSRAVTFVVDDLDHLYELFEQYVHKIYIDKLYEEELNDVS